MSEAPCKPWAERGLPPGDRAHAAAHAVGLEIGADFAPIREAIEAAIADALREAEQVARGDSPRFKPSLWANDHQIADAGYTDGRHDAADEILELLGEKAVARDEEIA
jgi:hypothetical protein